MGEWRELARTVPGTLLRVAEGTIGLLGTLGSAHRKLGAFIRVVGSLQRGGGSGDAISWDDVREQPNAGAALDDARRELVRLRELHSMASVVFVLCGGRARLAPNPEADPRWQAWAGHRGETSGHGSRALQSLRAAASHVRASRDALLMARSLPRRSTDRAAWVAAAMNLWRRAIWATTEAMLAARRMRDAVTVELEDAWMVLNR